MDPEILYLDWTVGLVISIFSPKKLRNNLDILYHFSRYLTIMKISINIDII